MSFPFWAALTEAAVAITSATAKHKIGTIGFTQDGRRFRYCKAGSACGTAGRLVANANYCAGATGHEDEDGFEGTFYTGGAVAGAHIVKIPDTAARAADYYQGAYLCVFHTSHYRCYYILGSKRNSAATDPGYGAYVELEIESGLDEAVTVSTGLTAYLSPYSNCIPYGAVGHIQGFSSWVALPLVPVTSGHFFWGQVGGPAWVTPHGGTWPGQAENYRDVFAHLGGTVDPASVCDPSAGYQRVGYLISATISASGDAFVMLQLDGG